MKKILMLLVIMFCLTGCESLKYKITTHAVNDNIKSEASVKTYKELTYDQYTKKINDKDTFIILLYQTGCSHCESYEPKLNKVISDYDLNVFALNLANLSDKEYAIVKNKTFISGTPTTVYIKEGKYDSKIIGDKDEQQIIDFLVDINYLEEK